MDLYELPHELFISIIQYLSPKELVLNRRVSKKSYNAFTEQEACRYMLLQHYPESREARGVSSVSCWADAFAEAASRYEHLKSGKTKSIEKHMLKSTVTFPALAKYYAVAPWDGQSIYEQKTIPFECPDTLWTYDEGLLIFPSAELQQYMLYDLNTGIVSIVDFHVEDKIVRRIRLNERVLIVEWSELDAYHRINEDGDMLFRHFATAYDLIQDSHEQWSIAFRSEWKIHKLGMALNSHDRFFSTHTATHYAIYIWQPNQSVWGENEPLEALAIWDIKSPSSYRPSLDPQARSKLETSEGPHVIRHFYLSDLTFNNIRQGSTPSLQNLELDESNIYIFSKEYSWLIDSQSGSPHSQYPTSRPDRYDHSARCTGIPFASGPRWEIRCGDDGTGVYCWSSQEYYRPSQAPCWILNYWNYYKTDRTTQATVPDARLVISAEHESQHGRFHIRCIPSIDITGPGFRTTLKHERWPGLLLGKGKICGDERWLIGENCSKGELVILHFDKQKRKLGLLRHSSRILKTSATRACYYYPDTFQDWKDFAVAWHL